MDRAIDSAARAEAARRSLPILDVGCCEPFKAVVHGVALGLTVVMGAYNAAAWIRRRQRHLAINAVIYLAAALWEERHVRHHIRACLPREAGQDEVVLDNETDIRPAA